MSTNPDEVRAGLIVLAAVVVIWAGMWWGWRNRTRRQADIVEPQWLTDQPAAGDTIEGSYLATTRRGDWLDRITAHGLGMPTRVTVAVDDGGLLVDRHHGRGWRIPAADLLGVRRDRGIAQKVREPDGIVVISWRLGDVELDTGIRPDDPDGGPRIEDAVTELLRRAVHG